MTNMAYIISRTLENKIAIAENNNQNTMLVTLNVLKEILVLLNEQEAIKPKIDAFGHPYCPKCKTLVYETWEFCPHCGRELIWND